MSSHVEGSGDAPSLSTGTQGTRTPGHTTVCQDSLQSLSQTGVHVHVAARARALLAPLGRFVPEFSPRALSAMLPYPQSPRAASTHARR